MIPVSALGALAALSIAIFLILKKVPPAYGMIVGALAGGLIGAAAEEGLTRTQGVEITVREDDGSMRAYVQEVQPNEVFRVGERVRISTVGGTSRVSH